MSLEVYSADCAWITVLSEQALLSVAPAMVSQLALYQGKREMQTGPSIEMLGPDTG